MHLASIRKWINHSATSSDSLHQFIVTSGKDAIVTFHLKHLSIK